MKSSITLQTVWQKPWYCGPTVLEILFSHFGRKVLQDDVVVAADMADSIIGRGCRIDELGVAITRLAADMVLLAKYNSSVDDVSRLTAEHNLPVGVEWRGTFLEPDGTIWEEGHYSVLTGVDWESQTITLVDPFYPGTNTAHRGGVIGIADFEARWWDENDVPLPDDANTTENIETWGLMFVLAPVSQAGELAKRGLRPISADLLREHRRIEKLRSREFQRVKSLG
ncbi:MAG: hypothetical protein H7175_14325 [Burkholderiales bacterium]|nr:hypothetical protein [Anaerolineae bacterium]